MRNNNVDCFVITEVAPIFLRDLAVLVGRAKFSRASRANLAALAPGSTKPPCYAG